MDAQGLKVLVIDDSSTIRRTAETLLSKAGRNVATASDWFDSLAKIVDIKPDVIFINIMMLSSKGGLFDKAKGRIVGADDYLTKPFGRAELLDALEKYI